MKLSKTIDAHSLEILRVLCIFIYLWIYLYSRLIGAKEVKGKTITFLDAHCECTEGWLEPLLNEIALNRKAVVCPIIDVISDDTFEYVTASDMTWGGFNWKLNFRWYVIYLYFFILIPMPQLIMSEKSLNCSFLKKVSRTSTRNGSTWW